MIADITIVQSRIINDGVMQTIWNTGDIPHGPVRTYYQMADRNLSVPYVTYNIHLGSTGDETWAIRPGLLTFRAYSFGPKAGVSALISERLDDLFRKAFLRPPASKAWMRTYQKGSPLPIATDSQNVWCLENTYDIRVYDVRGASSFVPR